MKYQIPLKSGLFLKRYKRFFADVRLDDGEVVVAHVPNTGSLKGCIESERLCRVSLSDNPNRKLKATLEMVQTPTSWVGVNTGLPSLLIKELFLSRRLPHWQDFDSLQGEVKISPESRVDFVLWNSKESYPTDTKLTLQHCLSDHKPLHFIEIKNVTYAENGEALFPDCESVRAQKHVKELMTLVRAGHSAEFVFVVQREDCTTFRPCHELDPKYANLLREAKALGVSMTALPCRLKEGEIELQADPLQVRLT